MKKIVIVLCWLMPLLSNAQVNKEIKFSPARNWQEVLDQAKKENKNIFIDLYATWCGPCKMMDRDVYTNKVVGDFVNANFIAVKVQMDSTKNDNGFVKGWYSDAVNWKVYVDAYPCFLFYSADGKFSGKNVGYYNVEDFLTLLKKVLDPKGNYLAQLDEFENGHLNEKQLLELAYWANDNKDSIVLKIAKAYKVKYLDEKTPADMLNPKTLRFFGDFSRLFRLNDPVIRYMYENKDRVEKALAAPKDWVNGYIDFLIRRDMLLDEHGNQISGEPEWGIIEKEFAKKFDPKTAKRALIGRKIYYAAKKGNWDEQAKYEFEQVEFRGIDTTDVWGMMTINDMLWEVVFTKVTNKDILNKAIKYMEVILQAKPGNYHFLDTYANLLYKAGFKDNGLKNQQKALLLASKDSDTEAVQSYGNKISKMEKNQPTWKME